MKKAKLILLCLSTIAIAQISSDSIVTPEVRRVGSHLACLCGACNNSVGDCAMLGCHYCVPHRQKIREMLAKGMSDDAIIASIVKEEGKQALVVPPNEGFNSLIWWMTPFMAGMGLMFIYWFIRRMRQPATIPAADPRVLDRYKASIEKDTDNLD